MHSNSSFCKIAYVKEFASFLSLFHHLKSFLAIPFLSSPFL